MSSDLLRLIAEGGEFDVVDGVRAMARALVLLNSGDGAVSATMQGPVPVMLQPAAATGDELLIALRNARLARSLRMGGFNTVAEVREASDAELLAAPDMTEKAVKQIREKLAG